MNPNKLIYKLKQLPRHGGDSSGTPGTNGEITVTTTSAIINKNNTLTLRGNVTANDGFSGTLEDKGFRFGNSTTAKNNPYTASSDTNFGSYSMDVSGIVPGKKYYFDAIARTAAKGDGFDDGGGGGGGGKDPGDGKDRDP